MDKFKKTRQALSFVVALVLAFSLAVMPALAEEQAESSAPQVTDAHEGNGNGSDIISTVVPVFTAAPAEASSPPNSPLPDENSTDIMSTVVPIHTEEPQETSATEGTGLSEQGEDIINTVMPLDTETPEPLGTEEPEETPEPEATIAPVISEAPVISVTLPSSMPFTIDPYEVDGKGQIYSELFEISNLGEDDVLLTLTTISVIFANDKDFEAVPLPFEEAEDFEPSKLKAIYMAMDFPEGDIPSVVLTDFERTEEVVISIPTGSSIFFSFSGRVNEMAAMDWLTGDVSIAIEYSIAPVLLPVEEEIANEEPTDADVPEEEASPDDTELNDGGQTEPIAETPAPTMQPQETPARTAAPEHTITPQQSPQQERDEPDGELPEDSEQGEELPPPEDGA